MMSVQRHDINARSVRTSRVWLACTEYFQARSVVDLPRDTRVSPRQRPMQRDVMSLSHTG